MQSMYSESNIDLKIPGICRVFFTHYFQYMGDFKKFKSFSKNKERRSSGAGFDGGRSFGRDRDRGPRQMFQATCAECRNSCEVPFKPVGGKPVLCNNCFKGKEDARPRFGNKSFSGGRDRGSFAPKGPAVTKEMFDSLNAKLDKILTILSLPQRAEHDGLDVGEVEKPTKATKTVAKKEKAVAKKAKAQPKKAVVKKEKKTKKK